MTCNHLLLYHLAELTFVHEQNILQVDLIFDDKQIEIWVNQVSKGKITEEEFLL